jgi:hypothetical protein
MATVTNEGPEEARRNMSVLWGEPQDKPGTVINVDHIEPRKKRPDLALVLENLQVLCHECNHGKSNWDTTDWRE